jgi:hypothetical protein
MKFMKIYEIAKYPRGEAADSKWTVSTDGHIKNWWNLPNNRYSIEFKIVLS